MPLPGPRAPWGLAGTNLGVVTPRRQQILEIAADLFASRGFHGVSVAELGAACGVSGPALYKHFQSKDAMLAEMLVTISETLLTEGRSRVATADGPREVDGLLNLDDFTEATGLELPEGPYETVAGYVLSALGRLPEVGDTIEVEGRRLTVLELDGRRIARLRVDPPPAPTEDGEDAQPSPSS